MNKTIHDRFVHLDREAREYIHSYRPQLPAERWDAIQAFVFEAIMVSGETSRHRIRLRMSILARFADWANLVQVGPIDMSLLTEQIIDAYAAHRVSENASATVERHRKMLRIMAGLANQTEIERDSTIATPTPPYSPAEQMEFLRKIEGMRRGKQRHSLLNALALGLGCGLKTREMAQISSEHFELADHGLDVHIPGNRSRTVTVVGEWEDILLEAIEHKGFLVFPDRKQLPNEFKFQLSEASLPTFLNIRRMRVTWILGLLQARVPLNLILEAAGLDGPYSLIRVLEYMPTVSAEERAFLLRTGGVL